MSKYNQSSETSQTILPRNLTIADNFQKSIPYSEYNIDEWDRFVHTHAFGSIYHLSGWKKALESTFRHIKGTLLTVRDSKTNKIVAGLPAYTVRSNLIGNRLVSIPMAWQGSPLFSTSDEMRLLTRQLIHLYHKEGASYIEIRSLTPSPDIHRLGFEISKCYQSHSIVLDKDPELLKNCFHKKSVRVPISKTKKNGLVLKHAKTHSDLICFYEVFKASRRHIGMPLVPYDFIKGLWDAFRPSNQITVLLAVHEGKAVGGSLLLKFMDTVTVEFGCDLAEYRKLYTNHYLDWQSIKLASREGYKIFQFGRTLVKNTGLLTYKSRWGTKSEVLPIYYYPEKFGLRDCDHKTSLRYKITKSILRNSPMPVFQLFSHFLSRHMG